MTRVRKQRRPIEIRFLKRRLLILLKAETVKALPGTEPWDFWWIQQLQLKKSIGNKGLDAVSLLGFSKDVPVARRT